MDPELRQEVEGMSLNNLELTFEEKYEFKIDPKWLNIIKNNLLKIYTPESTEKVYEGILQEHKRQQMLPRLTIKDMFSKEYRWRVFVSITLNILQQLTGINYFIFFSVKTFDEINNTGLLMFFISTNSMLLAYFPGKYFGDKYGRKWNMLVGNIFLSVNVVLLAIFTYIEWYPIYWLPLLVYVNAFSWGIGGSLLAYMGEILPPVGAMFGFAVQWFMAAVVGKVSPI